MKMKMKMITITITMILMTGWTVDVRSVWCYGAWNAVVMPMLVVLKLRHFYLVTELSSVLRYTQILVFFHPRLHHIGDIIQRIRHQISHIIPIIHGHILLWNQLFHFHHHHHNHHHHHQDNINHQNNFYHRSGSLHGLQTYCAGMSQNRRTRA